MTDRKSVAILGTRGIPAAHGGFETFAEHLSLYLVAQGWKVVVYCQHDVEHVTRGQWTDTWRGVERVHVEVTAKGSLGTLVFDWRSTRDAARRDAVCLVLGYNSAVYLPYLRLMGRTVVTNMDGIEWRRTKWSRPVRAWFWVNEWIAAWASNRLVADHPAIADHLATRRSREVTVMIPYGATPVAATAPDPVRALGLTPDRYLIAIARIEPENHILDIVRAFVQRPRDAKLVVLGTFKENNPYHRAIKAAANEAVLFPGAIYDEATVQALRYHARAYVHGHSVGGTNPSLVEALWAGNAVIAHDNPFNRWTAGPAQFFFSDIASCDQRMSDVLGESDTLGAARAAARHRAAGTFGWSGVLAAYAALLASCGAKNGVGAGCTDSVLRA